MSGAIAELITKADFVDSAKRLFEVMDRFEIYINRQYLQMVLRVRDNLPLRYLEQLITSGRTEEAFRIIHREVQKFAAETSKAFVAAGESTAQALSPLGALAFDQTNFRAVDVMRRNKLDLVREFLADQREATRQALTRGIAQGANPRVQARMFRESIGLTARQEGAVANYQSLLERRSVESLTRKLRDRRFDRTVSRAISEDKPLTPEQINRMTTRYRERYLKYRSETIARTESLSAVHEGSEEMYTQAIEEGTLDPRKIEQEWIARLDGRQRDSHDAMHRQKRPMGEPFVSGQGNFLRYPGDRQAPAEDRIQCRCGRTVRMKEVT